MPARRAAAALVLALISAAPGLRAQPDPPAPPGGPADAEVPVPRSRADAEVPVPRGSRAQGDRHVSALGFRATADWYEHLWRTRGIVVRAVGPYRVGGVDVIRYLRDDAGAPWRAVHVYRLAGKTWIAVVGAAAPP